LLHKCTIFYPLILNWITAAFNEASLKVLFFSCYKIFTRCLSQFP